MSFVNVEIKDGHWAEIQLDRPEAHNAISTAMAEDLVAACARVASEPGVRAVVISSTGEKSFCVGADLKERNSFSDAQLLQQRLVFRQAFGAVRQLPVPSIAAVHGFALGGGLEIALSCDLIVADETAVLGLPEVRVGLVPGGGGTQLLSRRIGPSAAADLIFTARQVRIDEAEALGLVNRRVSAGQDRSAAAELAAQIAVNSPVGLRNAKHALVAGPEVHLDAGLDIEDGAWRATAFSGDRHEGIAAFNEKRVPAWPGA
ncbi:enoyl-CoA hydratase/isomerase family protein [Georgenia sp. AZ-5]|uniref:enoyl-CoA hydratase/isomerase family protein n=1 Tax=Georgenia sp. AZ-5 TaxID=3367526 RepID=UPI003754041E